MGKSTMIVRLLLLPLLWTALASGTLPQAIEAFLARDKIDPKEVSILITETRSGKVLAEHRADDSRAPASVIKLATTYAALRTFGPEWRWPTQFYYTGSFRRGVITGDLVVKAYGDPTLSCGDLPEIVTRLKRMGIRKIEGDLLIDRSFFATDGRISSGFDNHPYSEYNAMPDALMFDDHLCRVIVDTQTGTPRVSKKVPDPGFRVVNRIRVTGKACRGRYSWPRVKITREGEVPTVILSGTLSKHCGPRKIDRVLGRPYTAFTAAFLRELKRQGIAFAGRMRLGKLPAGARELMTHYSPPLERILAKTNKKSNNLYARHIFLLLGAKLYGAPATEAKGRKAVKKVLGERGILGEETILDNGCGLSRRTRTTVRAMHRLLQDAYRSYAWTWMGTLAIAGVDGTIRKRFRNTPVRKRAWMKTGTLKDAKNIAGYVKGRSGKLYTVVIFYNGRTRWLGSLLQNQILEWIVKSK
jgi:D-alanyl-D-alanine carboxypeptidase/D-alanyl-D-alanine-endopeptidase (penicillin-binding protein 4)